MGGSSTVYLFDAQKYMADIYLHQDMQYLLDNLYNSKVIIQRSRLDLMLHKPLVEIENIHFGIDNKLIHHKFNNNWGIFLSN